MELPTPVEGAYPDGTKQKFDAMGPEKFSQWIKEQPKVFFTDTTMRDAHQSLFATRVRSIDMLRVLETASKKLRISSPMNVGAALPST